jgi:prepilin-type N-terminal cleavage/methylation domain-containing protein
MKARGYSLLELVVTIAIMSILLAITTINYQAWQVKNNVEKQTKEIQTDLSDLRLRALYSKMRHSVTLQPGGYEVKSFIDATDTDGTVVFRKELRYPITKSDGSSLAGEAISFDSRGFTNDVQTIRVTSPDPGTSLDCIVISNARTNAGRWKDGTCKQQ